MLLRGDMNRDLLLFFIDVAINLIFRLRLFTKRRLFISIVYLTCGWNTFHILNIIHVGISLLNFLIFGFFMHHRFWKSHRFRFQIFSTFFGFLRFIYIWGNQIAEMFDFMILIFNPFRRHKFVGLIL